MQKGINTNQKLQKCGESLLDSKYLDGGDNPKDVRCNIYDMTGNTMEWSTETCSSTGNPCVYSGAEYGSYIFCTSSRYGTYTTYSSESGSTRQILYL